MISSPSSYLAFLCACFLGSNSAEADVIPLLPGDPQHIATEDKVGDFNLIVSHYAPSVYAKPPFKPPYGLDQVELEWSSAGETLHATLSDDGETLNIIFAPNPIKADLGGKIECHWASAPLTYGQLRFPQKTWVDHADDFDRWYRSCPSLNQAERQVTVAQFRQAAKSIDKGVRRFRREVSRGFGRFSDQCLERTKIERPDPRPARSICIATFKASK